MDMHVHDTYFVIAHFHFIMVGGMVMGYMAGLHYWWPKITGRMYSRMVVAAGGAHHLRRLLPDVPAAVRGRLQRHAAPLPHVCPGVPGLERDVHRRGLDPRRRLCAAALLPAAVALVRQAGGPESLARDGAGVADAVAAADGQLSRPARSWSAALPIPLGKAQNEP